MGDFYHFKIKKKKKMFCESLNSGSVPEVPEGLLGCWKILCGVAPFFSRLVGRFFS